MFYSTFHYCHKHNGLKNLGQLLIPLSTEVKNLNQYVKIYVCLSFFQSYFSVCIINFKTTSFITRKYPLRGYILGVLTHTTALDQLWGGDETLTM